MPSVPGPAGRISNEGSGFFIMGQQTECLGFKRAAAGTLAQPGFEASDTNSDMLLFVGGAIERIQARPHSFSRQTAWAAMPSSRPVKPIFSSVVALTLTRSAGISSTAAIFSRIAGR